MVAARSYGSGGGGAIRVAITAVLVLLLPVVDAHGATPDWSKPKDLSLVGDPPRIPSGVLAVTPKGDASVVWTEQKISSGEGRGLFASRRPAKGKFSDRTQLGAGGGAIAVSPVGAIAATSHVVRPGEFRTEFTIAPRGWPFSPSGSLEGDWSAQGVNTSGEAIFVSPSSGEISDPGEQLRVVRRTADGSLTTVEELPASAHNTYAAAISEQGEAIVVWLDERTDAVRAVVAQRGGSFGQPTDLVTAARSQRQVPTVKFAPDGRVVVLVLAETEKTKYGYDAFYAAEKGPGSQEWSVRRLTRIGWHGDWCAFSIAAKSQPLFACIERALGRNELRVLITLGTGLSGKTRRLAASKHARVQTAQSMGPIALASNAQGDAVVAWTDTRDRKNWRILSARRRARSRHFDRPEQILRHRGAFYGGGTAAVGEAGFGTYLISRYATRRRVDLWVVAAPKEGGACRAKRLARGVSPLGAGRDAQLEITERNEAIALWTRGERLEVATRRVGRGCS